MTFRILASAFACLLLVGCQRIELKGSDYVPPFSIEERLDLSSIGYPVKTHQLQHADGSQAFGVSVVVDPEAPHVLVFPGNMQSVDRSLHVWSNLLCPLGVNVHLFDRRGQGRNDSDVDATRLASDAIAKFAFVRDTYGEAPSVVGYSLGSFEAIAVAQAQAPSQLALIAASTNIDEHLDASVPWYFKPFLRFDIDEALYTLDNRAAIAEVDTDTLFIAAENDRQTPPSLTKALYEASAAENRSLHIVSNVHHNNVLQSPETAAHLCRFFGFDSCGDNKADNESS